MELSLVNSLYKIPGSGSVAILKHSIAGKVEEFSWSVKAFDRNRQKTNNLGYEEEVEAVDPFDQLNLYWKELPIEQQDKIFAVYKRIYDVFESSNNLDALMSGLIPLIQTLFDLHPIEDLKYWINMKSTICIPKEAKVCDTIEENIEKGEQFGSHEWPRESTYIKVDYWGLIVLIMLLRILYPVWGRFMHQ